MKDQRKQQVSERNFVRLVLQGRCCVAALA
jgi:hypothetical protein